MIHTKLNGTPLPPYPKLDEMIRNMESPGSRRDPTWTYSFLEKELAWIPVMLSPMWDCFLMLWRLKELAPEGDDDESDAVWQTYTISWIVSHVCPAERLGR